MIFVAVFATYNAIYVFLCPCLECNKSSDTNLYIIQDNIYLFSIDNFVLGENSPFTEISRKILTTCREALAEYDEELTRLEEEISLLPEETDSNTGDIPSRSDSVDRDETYLSQLDVTGSVL
jgi:hypothetical protein